MTKEDCITWQQTTPHPILVTRANLTITATLGNVSNGSRLRTRCLETGRDTRHDHPLEIGSDLNRWKMLDMHVLCYPGDFSDTCTACHDFTQILLMFRLDIDTFGDECPTHGAEIGIRCSLFATYAKLQGVGLNVVATVDEAVVALPGQALAVHISQETTAMERRSDEHWKIRRDFEFASITELLKRSAFIQDYA